MDKPDFLYHYTNLESLALILKTKKIRFKQLSLMDDLQEGQSQDPEHYEEFIFASAWTEDYKESIPMWKMYSSQFSGIRMKLPSNPFKKEPLDYGENPYFAVTGPEPACLKKVDYVDDKDKLKPKAFLNLGSGYAHAIPLLGWRKSTAWDFQKEWRYLIYFTPICKMEIESPDAFKKATKRYCQKGYLPFTYVDLPLLNDALLQAEITYSPWFTEGNKVLLKCLLSEKAPNIKPVASSLTGKIR